MGGCYAFNTLTGEPYSCPAACPTGVDLLESSNVDPQAFSIRGSNSPLEENGLLAAWPEKELTATFSLGAHSNGSLIVPRVKAWHTIFESAP